LQPMGSVSMKDETMKIVMENEKVEKASVQVDKPGALRFTDSVSVTQTESR